MALDYKIRIGVVRHPEKLLDGLPSKDKALLPFTHERRQ